MVRFGHRQLRAAKDQLTRQKNLDKAAKFGGDSRQQAFKDG
jgi:hypothetical protein